LRAFSTAEKKQWNSSDNNKQENILHSLSSTISISSLALEANKANNFPHFMELIVN